MDTVQATVKNASIFSKWFVKRNLQRFKEEMVINEKLLGMGPIYEKTSGFIFITDKRIVKYDMRNSGYLKVIIPIDKIVSYNFKRNIVSYDIEVKSSHQEIEGKHIPILIGKELEKIITNLVI